jgi:hypothetical protein
MLGTTTRTLKEKVTKETRLKLYKIVAGPVLSYRFDSWILRGAIQLLSRNEILSCYEEMYKRKQNIISSNWWRISDIPSPR